MTVFINRNEKSGPSKAGWFLLRWTITVVNAFSPCVSTAQCPKPVIVAIHGACVGGGVDLIAACDIRLCSSDAWFQIKVGWELD